MLACLADSGRLDLLWQGQESLPSRKGKALQELVQRWPKPLPRRQQQAKQQQARQQQRAEQQQPKQQKLAEQVQQQQQASNTVVVQMKANSLVDQLIACDLQYLKLPGMINDELVNFHLDTFQVGAMHICHSAEQSWVILNNHYSDKLS